MSQTEKKGNSSVAELEPEKKIKQPKNYKVLLHNDDFTPMDFVVDLLCKVFHKGVEEAAKIMMAVHTKGVAVAGVYSHEIAEQKVSKVTAIAREAQYPLLATLEPE
jgi:ATP-dependent Clp protease adaptor protein ClpS